MLSKTIPQQADKIETMNEQEFYNQQFEKYKQYDRHRVEAGALNLELAEHYFKHLVQSHSDTEGTLIDLGCGDGYFTSKLTEFNGAVIGVEFSSLINAANELLKTDKSGKLQFLKEDADKLSIEDQSVELVISRRGPSPEKEVFRILKHQGVFIFITIGEMDSHSLKEIVGRGQHFGSSEKVSDELKSKFRTEGFSEVFCKDFFYDENYSSSGDLKEFLHQVPIFDNFSKSDYSSIDDYCEKYEKHKIKLERHRVVLLARKAS